MTKVAKGNKKPSHSSNMSLATVEFLMKVKCWMGKVLWGTRYHGSQFVAMATKKVSSPSLGAASNRVSSPSGGAAPDRVSSLLCGAAPNILV